MQYLMKCGHVSNAKNEYGRYICGICDCAEIVSECSGTKGLEGRFALCCQHKHMTNNPVASSWELPFFKYQPDRDFDAYYCGCYGWD